MNQSIPEEYYNNQEQEVISLYKQHYQADRDTEEFYEIYLNTLKTVQKLGTSDPSARKASINQFTTTLKNMIRYRNKEQIGESLLESAMKELFDMIDNMLKAIQSHIVGGGIVGSTVILQNYNHREFEDEILNRIFAFLQEQDFSSLPEILDYLRAYIRKHGTEVIENMKQKLFELIGNLWNKYENQMEEEGTTASVDDFSEYPSFHRGLLKIIPDVHFGIESLYKVLSVFIEELPEGSPILDGNLLEAVFKTRNHPKQRVRALCCDVLGVLVTKLSNEVWNGSFALIGEAIIDLMGDETTIARYRATVHIFKFIDRAAASHSLDQFSASIIPRILMNRYYPDQAVKNETKNLWKKYLEKIGMERKVNEVLAKLTNNSCEFYLQQLRYSNAEVLQAACFALKELINKIKGSTETIQAHFDEIMNVCLGITKHENPLARAATFQVLESLVTKFPPKSHERLSDLLNAGFFQICVNNNSEENAELIASSLVVIYNTYTEELHPVYLENIREKLSLASRGEEKIKLKEEIKYFSYDDKITRPTGFEVATGALILLKKIIVVQKEFLDANLESLHQIVTLNGVAYHDSMILYAWGVLNLAFAAWDVKLVKPEFEFLMGTLFRDLRGRVAMVLEANVVDTKQKISVEVSQILKTIATKIGANVFKTRVESVLGNQYSKEVQAILSS